MSSYLHLFPLFHTASQKCTPTLLFSVCYRINSYRGCSGSFGFKILSNGLSKLIEIPVTGGYAALLCPWSISTLANLFASFYTLQRGRNWLYDFIILLCVLSTLLSAWWLSCAVWWVGLQVWDLQCWRSEDSNRNPTLLKTAGYMSIIVIVFVICSLTRVMTPKVMLIFIPEVMSKCLSFSLTFTPLFLLLSKRSVANECSFQQFSPVLVLEVSDAITWWSLCPYSQAAYRKDVWQSWEKKINSKIVIIIPIKSMLSK